MSIPTFKDQFQHLKCYLKGLGADISEENSPEGPLADMEQVIGCCDLIIREATESDAESILNNIVALLIIIPPSDSEHFVLTFCEKLTKAPTLRMANVCYRVLMNLYAGIHEHCALRIDVYFSLVKVAGQTDNVNTIFEDITKLKNWLNELNISIDKTQKLLRLLHEVLLECKQSELASKVMIELLGTYTEDNASQARDDAHKCIVTSLAGPNTLRLDHLLVLKPVKFLEGELIHDLLTIFVSEKLSSYLSFYATNKDFVNSLGLSHEQNLQKMRLVTFMQMAESRKKIPLSIIESELQLKPDEVERFIIDGPIASDLRIQVPSELYFPKKIALGDSQEMNLTIQNSLYVGYFYKISCVSAYLNDSPMPFGLSGLSCNKTVPRSAGNNTDIKLVLAPNYEGKIEVNLQINAFFNSMGQTLNAPPISTAKTKIQYDVLRPSITMRSKEKDTLNIGSVVAGSTFVEYITVTNNCEVSVPLRISLFNDSRENEIYFGLEEMDHQKHPMSGGLRFLSPQVLLYRIPASKNKSLPSSLDIPIVFESINGRVDSTITAAIKTPSSLEVLAFIKIMQGYAGGNAKLVLKDPNESRLNLKTFRGVPCSETVTVINVGSLPVVYDIHIEGDNGVLSVSPTSVKLEPNATAAICVTFTPSTYLNAKGNLVAAAHGQVFPVTEIFGHVKSNLIKIPERRSSIPTDESSIGPFVCTRKNLARGGVDIGKSCRKFLAGANGTEIIGIKNIKMDEQVEHNIPYFRNLFQTNITNLQNQCKIWEEICLNNSVPDDVLGDIRTNIGVANLLLNEKLKRFKGLIDDCEFNTGETEITCLDLQGFWDMVYNEVTKINKCFTRLEKSMNNEWNLEDLNSENMPKRKVHFVSDAEKSKAHTKSEKKKGKRNYGTLQCVTRSAKKAMLAQK